MDCKATGNARLNTEIKKDDLCFINTPPKISFYAFIVDMKADNFKG